MAHQRSPRVAREHDHLRAIVLFDGIVAIAIAIAISCNGGGGGSSGSIGIVEREELRCGIASEQGLEHLGVTSEQMVHEGAGLVQRKVGLEALVVADSRERAVERQQLVRRRGHQHQHVDVAERVVQVVRAAAEVRRAQHGALERRSCQQATPLRANVGRLVGSGELGRAGGVEARARRRGGGGGRCGLEQHAAHGDAGVGRELGAAVRLGHRAAVDGVEDVAREVVRQAAVGVEQHAPRDAEGARVPRAAAGVEAREAVLLELGARRRHDAREALERAATIDAREQEHVVDRGAQVRGGDALVRLRLRRRARPQRSAPERRRARQRQALVVARLDDEEATRRRAFERRRHASERAMQRSSGDAANGSERRSKKNSSVARRHCRRRSSVSAAAPASSSSCPREALAAARPVPTTCS